MAGENTASIIFKNKMYSYSYMYSYSLWALKENNTAIVISLLSLSIKQLSRGIA